jgi:pSer/pThr/pTyr-binding forkhead associated (FHA) protein
MLFFDDYCRCKGRAPMAKFMVYYEGKPLNTYMIDEPVFTIGRLPENTISIPNMGVSRRHVRIEEDYDRKLILSDLNSLNGTTVNGKRVKKVPLHSGDKIVIGKFTIIYEEVIPGTEVSLGQPGAASVALPAQTEPVKGSDTRTFHKPAGLQQNDGGPSEPSQTQKTPAVQEYAVEGRGPMLIETAKHITYQLDKPYMTIGSGESDDIPVNGFMVGEQQAFIEQTGEGLRIGTNKFISKVKINGRTVKSHLVKHKDRIDIGSNTFRYMENG